MTKPLSEKEIKEAIHESNQDQKALVEKFNSLSVKLEMTAKELDMMIYMLGAIDLRTEPATLEIAMALRKKLDNAQKFLKAKPKQQKDKYGKEIEKAQALSAQARNSDMQG